MAAGTRMAGDSMRWTKTRTRRTERSEAALLDLFSDQLLELPDVLLLLLLEGAPAFLELGLPVRVGDVLIVPPERIEALAEVLDQVVVVVRGALGLAHVLGARCLRCCCRHDVPPLA